MALGLVWGARELFRTMDDTVDSSKPPEATSSTAVGAAAAGSDDATGEGEEAAETSSTTTPVLHLPNEVIVRVGNGAERKGVATVGTDMITQAGYATLGPKNAPATNQSIVYFLDGYQADAVEVARLLGVPAAQIAAMPADPGISVAEAHLVVILGSDTTIG